MTRPALLEQRRPQKPVQNLKKGQSVNTLTQTSVSPAAPQAATPYFRREAEFDQAVRDEEARRGLTPEPWAA